MTGCVAVFDLGKTNMKLVAFDRAGKVAAERSQANAPLAPDARWPYLRLDTERAWAFLLAALRDVGASLPIEAISISTHGGAGVVVGDEDFALPPMDYEFDGFAAVDAAYEAARPPFEEGLSPLLTRGLNLGRQIFFLERSFPHEFNAARAFLAYPQYWAWRLSGVMATEATSLGAHSDLWRPNEGCLSSLVERQGWTRLFPPRRNAWDTLGPLKPEVAAATGLSPSVRVVCGSHDSNASLVPYLISRSDPFTVVSTGTWVIMMAVGGKGRLDPEADMLANVDVTGRPVPTARLMGGREFSELAGPAPADATEAAIAVVVASNVMAMPAFSDQGGPYAGRKGWIEGAAPTAPAARAALATVYSALMTAHMLRRLEAPGDIIVEGGFNRSPAYAAVLAALMPGRTVLRAPASGAAEGAAMLARWGEPHDPPLLAPVQAWDVPGLAEYARRWEQGLTRAKPHA
jgi:sugar (pentulose or hexulose) kinase